jgi:hypothetical protein
VEIQQNEKESQFTSDCIFRGGQFRWDDISLYYAGHINDYQCRMKRDLWVSREKYADFKHKPSWAKLKAD